MKVNKWLYFEIKDTAHLKITEYSKSFSSYYLYVMVYFTW